MASTQPSYIIVGAGVFGTSTALHLITQHPDASVTLIDRDAYDAPTRVAASWDWNKAVRADYRDLAYCRLALEAQAVWRHDPLWRPYYHESGIFWISRTDIAERVVDNFRALGAAGDLEGKLYALPVEEARRLHGGIFADADYAGITNVLINRSSGWADAKGALRAVTVRAVQLGVRYVTAEVETLEFDDDGEDGGGGACTGVRTRGGESFKASRTILSTGSFTPKLLEMTADRTGREALRAGDRIVAAGVTTGMVTLDEAEAERFKGMPVNCQENDPSRGASNGTFPPNADRQIKWWGQCTFKNTQEVSPGRRVSAPPPHPDYAQWQVPDRLKEDIAFANKLTFGKIGEKWEYHSHRICWDALTPSEDFIISPHAACAGLYVATCGSFHGYKFFPVLGRYVAQMLDGTLDDALARRWAWDRPLPPTTTSPPDSEQEEEAGTTRKHNIWMPKHELADLQK
ncbi:FAD dependent oxidoreductase [Xylariaceae sp. FL0804]|nr:FAD dependent oxidoreductase [Xylariaceae sp. FL0804]